MRDFFRLYLPVAASFVLLCCFALLAMTTRGEASEPNRPAPDSDTARIELRGVISPRCEFGGGDTAFMQSRLHLGELTDPTTGGLVRGQGELRFNVRCNHRFSISISSLNGALVRGDGQGFQSIAQRGFHTRIPYGTQLQMFAPRNVITNHCSSADLVSARCNPRFPRTAGLSQAVLQIAWEGDGQPVLAGRYTDRIIIKISPSVGGE